MGEIINLKQVRKERARAAKTANAEANRAKFGRTKADKSLAEGEADVTGRRLDQHRIERPDEPA